MSTSISCVKHLSDTVFQGEILVWISISALYLYLHELLSFIKQFIQEIRLYHKTNTNKSKNYLTWKPNELILLSLASVIIIYMIFINFGFMKNSSEIISNNHQFRLLEAEHLSFITGFLALILHGPIGNILSVISMSFLSIALIMITFKFLYGDMITMSWDFQIIYIIETLCILCQPVLFLQRDDYLLCRLQPSTWRRLTHTIAWLGMQFHWALLTGIAIATEENINQLLCPHDDLQNSVLLPLRGLLRRYKMANRRDEWDLVTLYRSLFYILCLVLHFLLIPFYRKLALRFYSRC